jgi:hypothetical protein
VSLEPENHAALLGLEQALLDAVDDPLEAVFFGVAGQDRLDAAIGHQFVEVPARAPSAGVEADDRNAESVSGLNLPQRQVDVLLAFLFIWRDEPLMCRHTAEIQAVDECVTFDLLQVAVFLAFHLVEQQIHAVESHPRRLVDALFDGHLHPFLEAPERVCRDGNRIGPA